MTDYPWDVAADSHSKDDDGPRASAGLALAVRNQKMLEVRQLVERVADTDVTVLIRGESGTGKELVAREIHEASPRRTRAFVKVNCAALPSELVESELFGFERGAFTGAIQRKAGKFEFAHQGTLFLDEIAELPPIVQVKLLHVLQGGEFSRLGGRDDIHVDARVLTATNRNLEQALADGLFREDLYFRLNVVCITLPPLRERRDEIPALIDLFIRDYCEKYNRPLITLDAATTAILSAHDWPGNIRELENVVKRLVLLGDDGPTRQDLAGAAILRAHRPGPAAPETPRAAAEPPARPATSAAQRISGTLKDIARHAARGAEREVIFRTLQQTRWNRREAAQRLGVSYKALLYKIKEAEFDPVS